MQHVSTTRLEINTYHSITQNDRYVHFQAIVYYPRQIAEKQCLCIIFTIIKAFTQLFLLVLKSNASEPKTNPNRYVDFKNNNKPYIVEKHPYYCQNETFKRNKKYF